jgi:hypothetical protein
LTAEVIQMKKHMLEEMPLEDILVNRANILTRLFDTKTDLQTFNDEIVRRAAEKKATVLFTDKEQIKVERDKKIQHRFDVLRRLEGKIPADVYEKAVYQETPPPIWKADTVKLKWIARNCGSEAAEIVEQGMPYEEVGNPKITVTPLTHANAQAA